MIVPISGRLWRELLLGPAYWWHRRLIRQSKNWTPEQQTIYQRQKLRRLFSEFDANVVRSKDHYRNSQGIYDRIFIKWITKVVRTGGSTGSPFAFYRDTLFRRQKERAYLFDIWASAGYRPFDLRVVFRGSIKNKLISYSLLENCYVISPGELTQANSKEVLAFLQTLPFFFLHVYPSSLVTFIEILGENAFKDLPIRGVLAGSEVFPPSQLQAFERKFGLKVAHWYGHSEYATLAKHCRQCGGFHFYPTYGYTELIPTKNGRLRIVATSFNMIGTKFVRYDTGDFARLGNLNCAEPFLRVQAIEGREQEFFLDRDGYCRAFGPYLFGIHDEFWDRILAIQFIQKQPGQLDVKVVARIESYRPWLEDYLRKRFVVCELHFEYVDQVQTTPAGKHRYFVSLLQ